MKKQDGWPENAVHTEGGSDAPDCKLFIQRLEQQNEVLRRKNIDLLLEIEMLKDMLRHREH